MIISLHLFRKEERKITNVHKDHNRAQFKKEDKYTQFRIWCLSK